MHHFENMGFSSATLTLLVQKIVQKYNDIYFETLVDVQNTFSRTHFLSNNHVSRGEYQFIIISIYHEKE